MNSKAKPSSRLSRMILCVLLPALLGGCSTAAKIRELETQRLVAQRDALVQIKTALDAEPDPFVTHQAELFIGESGLNKLFAATTQFTFGVPRLKDVAIEVRNLSVDFVNGSAQVHVDAQAKHLKHKYQVGLETQAQLALRAGAQPGDPMTLQVHVVKMVPRAKWNFLNFRFGLFIQRLLRIKASAYLAAMPAVTMPVTDEMPFKYVSEPISIELGDATATGPLHAPSINSNVKVTIDRWYMLADGLHAFIKLEKIQ